jgi:hypothetical protein
VGGDHNVVFFDEKHREFPFDKDGNIARSFEVSTLLLDIKCGLTYSGTKKWASTEIPSRQRMPSHGSADNSLPASKSSQEHGPSMTCTRPTLMLPSRIS